MIKANNIIGTGFPPEEGTKLAEVLLKRRNVRWDDLEVDLRGLPASLLISAFFNGFLQCIFERAPDLLLKAKAIRWDLDFAFQTENVRRWMTDFKPVSNGHHGSSPAH